MKKYFTYFFEKWWIPIIIWAFSIIFFYFVDVYSKNNILEKVSYILLVVSLLFLLTSAIFQFLKKHWLFGIATVLTPIITIVLIIILVIFQYFINTVEGDKWADNLEIPDNIALNIPKGNGCINVRPDSILNIKRTKNDFEIYNSFQPGLYEYDFWTGKIESGIIYLKAYEITQEYPLSTDRLAEQSSVKIYNPTDSIMRFGTTSDFTIYEGDWGKPYAARFEVWFKPDNGGQERKLIQKNYKIEGWQR